MKYSKNYFIKLGLIVVVNLIGFKYQSVFAQVEDVNPLLIKEKDELLPSIDRPLTDFEVRRLREELGKLDQEAEQQFKAGNLDEAFAIWYRKVRVIRTLSVEEEITSLRDLGTVAWENSRSQDIDHISKRLLVIESENKNNQGEVKLELVPLFSQAYEAIHNIDKSIEFSQKILKIARAENDISTIKNTLEKLGQSYLAKFNYYEAEPIYKELLTIAKEQQDYLNEGIYLRRLAEINSEIVNPENAVVYKKELEKNYVANQQLQILPDLKIAIADDYKDLDNAQEATEYYQQAFNLAWSLQQFATAADALKKLGRLYQDYNQNEYALQIYQELIKIEQQSYNLYGLMNTYDHIGEIYAKESNYDLASQWFEKSLEIANYLQYKVDYFNTKIQQVNQLK